MNYHLYILCQYEIFTSGKGACVLAFVCLSVRRITKKVMDEFW